MDGKKGERGKNSIHLEPLASFLWRDPELAWVGQHSTSSFDFPLFFFFFLRYLFKSQLRSIHGLQIVGLESVIRKENLAFELHELSPSQHCDYLQY